MMNFENRAHDVTPQKTATGNVTVTALRTPNMSKHGGIVHKGSRAAAPTHLPRKFEKCLISCEKFSLAVTHILYKVHELYFKFRYSRRTLSAANIRVRDMCLWDTGYPRRNGQNFGRVFLMLDYTDITQNTYIQSWTVTEIMAREVSNFDSCYTLIVYQIHIKTGRNMWLL